MEPERDGTDPLPHDQRRARRPSGDRALRRGRATVLGGVASGVAAYVGADPRVVRWLFVVALPLSLGIALPLYLLLWLLLPSHESGPGD